MESVGINSYSNEWCVSGTGNYIETTDGIYSFNGCDKGFPYYLHTSCDVTVYIHFDWCYAVWIIGIDYTTWWTLAYCQQGFHLENCTNNLYEYDINSNSYINNNVIIEQCNSGNNLTVVNVNNSGMFVLIY